jgi:hypothetical protein
MLRREGDKMDKDEARGIVDYVFENLFSRKNPYSLAEIEKIFAFDIPLPKKKKCALSGKDTWSFSREGRIASQKAIAGKFARDEWMMEKKPVNSAEDVLKYWREINFITGDKIIDSKEVAKSDGVYNSSQVYKGNSIFGSKHIVFSYKIVDSSYLVASRDNGSCQVGLRVKDSLYCSNVFEVSWSNRVSNSFYIHDSFDLFECIFCSHIRTKKYCVGNMRFEKEEYFRIKKMMIDWILKGKQT